MDSGTNFMQHIYLAAMQLGGQKRGELIVTSNYSQVSLVKVREAGENEVFTTELLTCPGSDATQGLQKQLAVGPRVWRSP